MQKTGNKDQKVVTLICDDCDCCPEVIREESQVVIKDDFGGRVKLTKEEFEILKTKIKQNEL